MPRGTWDLRFKTKQACVERSLVSLDLDRCFLNGVDAFDVLLCCCGEELEKARSAEKKYRGGECHVPFTASQKQVQGEAKEGSKLESNFQRDMRIVSMMVGDGRMGMELWTEKRKGRTNKDCAWAT